MPTFALSGAHVGAKFGIFKTLDLINAGAGQNYLLGKHGTIPTSLLDGGVFYDFPYLQSIAITFEGSVQTIQAIGLQNIAALEEVAIGFQDITIELLAQPIPAMEKIFSMFKRTSTTYNHYPFVALRLGVKGAYYREGGNFRNALIDIWSCVPRQLSFNQPEGGAATLRLTLGGGYIYTEFPSNTDVSVAYNINKGILNVYEGVVRFYADEQGNNPILPDIPFYISSLSIDIRNTVNPFHTFLGGNFTDESYMKAVRLWRAVMDAIQVVEGSVTLLTPRDITTQLNLNKLTQVGRMDILYYPFAGSSAPSSGVPSNYEMKISLYYVKFTRSNTNITPDRVLQWTVNFNASHPSQEAWAFEVTP